MVLRSASTDPHEADREAEWRLLLVEIALARGNSAQAEQALADVMPGQVVHDVYLQQRLLLTQLRVALSKGTPGQHPVLTPLDAIPATDAVLVETALLHSQFHIQMGNLAATEAALREAEQRVDPLARPILADLAWHRAQWAHAAGDTAQATAAARTALYLWESMGHHRAAAVRQWMRERGITYYRSACRRLTAAHQGAFGLRRLAGG